MQHYRNTLRLGFPIAIGQLGTIILTFADTAMVGRYGTPELAAASFVNSLFNMVTMLLLGYSYGITPLISTAYGQNRICDAGEILRRGLRTNLLFGTIVLTLIGLLYFALPLMGQPKELLPLIRPYYLEIWFSMWFVVIFSCLRQFTDATTDTRSAMWMLIGSNVVNIGLNSLLIFGLAGFPEWGLFGAGFATAVSRVLMAVGMLWLVFRSSRYAAFWSIDGTVSARQRAASVRQIHQQSWPVSAQLGLETFAFTFATIMAGWLGKIELASVQVLITLGSLGFTIYYSFASGMSIRIAHFLAQHDWTSARDAATAGRNILLGNAVVSSSIFVVGGSSLIGYFTEDASVVAMSVSLLPLLVLYQFADALQVCYANSLRATGYVRPMTWIAFVSYLGIGVPAAYLLGFPLGGGLDGFYCSFSLCLFAAALGFFYYYRRRMAVLRDELRSV